MKKAISITIDEDIYKVLKDEAEEQNRKLSNLIETILQEWLDDKEV